MLGTSKAAASSLQWMHAIENKTFSVNVYSHLVLSTWIIAQANDVECITYHLTHSTYLQHMEQKDCLYKKKLLDIAHFND